MFEFWKTVSSTKILVWRWRTIPKRLLYIEHKVFKRIFFPSKQWKGQRSHSFRAKEKITEVKKGRKHHSIVVLTTLLIYFLLQMFLSILSETDEEGEGIVIYDFPSLQFLRRISSFFFSFQFFFLDFFWEQERRTTCC